MQNIPALHTMSEYSFLHSTIKIKDLIAFALAHNLEAVAITDHNNMFGVARFVKAAQHHNLKPIIGVDLDVADYRLVLIAKNYRGFEHLCQLVSRHGHGEKISLKQVLSSDIFIFDHPQYGHAQTHHSPLPCSDFFNTTDPTKPNYAPLHYTRMLNQNEIDILETLDRLSGNKDKNIASQFYHYQPSDPKMAQTILTIVDQIDVKFPDHPNPIPQFLPPKKANAALRHIIDHNKQFVLPQKWSAPAYEQRLDKELAIIEKLNFANYFLIIYDLVKWARQQNILIGPGRGSAAGSLVAHILQITALDPLAYGLIFERFLNPERITMPDIDIDIEDDKRDQVINYLFQKYGPENTALISTFQKLGAKSSLHDIGRMMNMPNHDVLAITKLVPPFATLEIAYQTNVRFRARINQSELNTKLFNQAQKIEGLPRQLGTHAAGVVIADHVISEHVPTIKSSEGKNQTQYSMNYLEQNGLLKIDLLGLRNLTIVHEIEHTIKTIDPAATIPDLPTHDELTNKLLSRGKTSGIFQLESYGMRKTVQTVGVTGIDDLAAIISLYRPGPMEFIDQYARTKKGDQPITKINPIYDKIVAPTYGILVYQEQIMELAQKYAGMSFGRADILRRAIGKKDPKTLAQMQHEFITLATKQGHDVAIATKIYQLIARFADYGFNKSHAYAYAALSYKMAYLKTHFPQAFYTALINHATSSPKSLKQYINEATSSNINIVAPHLNWSQTAIAIVDQALVLPLVIIKGVGKVAVIKIITERDEHGPYQDFFKTVARLKHHSLGEGVIKALIKAQALRQFGTMPTLLRALSQALRYASMVTIKHQGVAKLNFDLLPVPQLELSEPDFKQTQKAEQEVLGFNLTAFRSASHETATKLNTIQPDTSDTVVCEVVNIKPLTDKNGRSLALVTLRDSSLTIEAFAFYNSYETVVATPPGAIVKAVIKWQNHKYAITKKWEVIHESIKSN